MIQQKKAVSPVITTMLLVLLAIVLASIIFLWARGFVGEQVSKFERPISESCGNVRLSGVLSAPQITISNNGNVPIFKVGVRVTDTSGNSNIEYKEINLFQGSSLTITPSLTLDNRVDLIPVLLGKSSKGGTSEYNCLDNIVNIQ